jgi:hypothetical protein
LEVGFLFEVGNGMSPQLRDFFSNYWYLVSVVHLLHFAQGKEGGKSKTLDIVMEREEREREREERL